MRKIESLPEEQVYQVLDYIEFLESRYASPDLEKEASGLQRLAEGIEDRLRNRSFNPSNLREAWQVVAAADRALSGVAKAGRQLLEEIAGAPGAVKPPRRVMPVRRPDLPASRTRPAPTRRAISRGRGALVPAARPAGAFRPAHRGTPSAALD